MNEGNAESIVNLFLGILNNPEKISNLESQLKEKDSLSFIKKFKSKLLST